VRRRHCLVPRRAGKRRVVLRNTPHPWQPAFPCAAWRDSGRASRQSDFCPDRFTPVRLTGLRHPSDLHDLQRARQSLRGHDPHFSFLPHRNWLEGG
ncbi:MAG: hypothetical protein ACK56I_14815, partial [bacterium]